MKRIFILLSLFVFSVTANAGLVEEVDKLTPEEAYQVMTKLQAKTMKPIPEGFFTHLSAGISGGILYVDPKDVKDGLDDLHTKDKQFSQVPMVNASLLWKVQNLMVGMGFNAIRTYSSQFMGGTVYESVMLSGVSMQLLTGYRFEIGSKWIILPTVGVGGIVSRFRKTVTDDIYPRTYKSGYYGYGLSASGNLALMYRLNSVFSMGLEGTYLYAKIDQTRRATLKLQSPDKIDLSGGGFGFKFAFNL